MGANLVFLTLAACASADVFQAPDITFERSAKALEMPNRSIQSGPSDVGEYTCRYAGQSIHYSGNTTLQLVNCLLDAPNGAQRLLITSAGGNVDLGIFAAHVLKARALDVEVVGMCMSSCANYILPAAERLFVDQHSAILVHGSGPPPNRDDMIAALALSGFTETSPNFAAVLEDNMKRSELTYRLHNNFKRHFRVGDGYYDLEDIWSARRTQGQGNQSGMVLVDPQSLQSCLPDVEVIAEAPNLEGLQRLLPHYNLGSFADVRGAGSACSD